METPFAKAANRAGPFMPEPIIAALPLTPSPCRYCRTRGAITDAEPASARPKPSRMDFRPNSKTSLGISPYFVFTINSETYFVRPGALGKAALSGARGDAASRSFPAANAAAASELLTNSRRIILVHLLFSVRCRTLTFLTRRTHPVAAILHFGLISARLSHLKTKRGLKQRV